MQLRALSSRERSLARSTTRGEAIVGRNLRPTLGCFRLAGPSASAVAEGAAEGPDASRESALPQGPAALCVPTPTFVPRCLDRIVMPSACPSRRCRSEASVSPGLRVGELQARPLSLGGHASVTLASEGPRAPVRPSSRRRPGPSPRTSSGPVAFAFTVQVAPSAPSLLLFVGLATPSPPASPQEHVELCVERERRGEEEAEAKGQGTEGQPESEPESGSEGVQGGEAREEASEAREEGKGEHVRSEL